MCPKQCVLVCQGLNGDLFKLRNSKLIYRHDLFHKSFICVLYPLCRESQGYFRPFISVAVKFIYFNSIFHKHELNMRRQAVNKTRRPSCLPNNVYPTSDTSDSVMLTLTGAFAVLSRPGDWAFAYPGASPGHLTHLFSEVPWMSSSGKTRRLSNNGLSVRN